VVEVGQVGRARSAATNTTQLYLHRQPGAAYGSPEPLYAAFRRAEDATGGDYRLAVANASARNPGLPPSSLHVLLRWKPQLQALYLGDFDSQFANPYYQSRCGQAGAQARSCPAPAAAARRRLAAAGLHHARLAGNPWPTGAWQWGGGVLMRKAPRPPLRCQQP
jgi:hypothetical protein